MNIYLRNSLFFAAGAAAGAAAGILLAPDKGSETRQKLAKRAKEFEKEFADVTKSVKETFDETKEKLFKKSEEVVI